MGDLILGADPSLIRASDVVSDVSPHPGSFLRDCASSSYFGFSTESSCEVHI